MKLLISTPCYGGQLTDKYVGSLMESIALAKEENLISEAQVHFQGKESLIPRARNRAALFCLEGGFDRLFTIDADIEWSYEDFRRILSSEKKIIGGVYPLKTFPVVANFNPIQGKGTELLSSNRGYDLDAFERFCSAYAGAETGEAEVRHVPTGFLSVSAEVLAKLSETVPVYWSFQPDSGEKKGFFDFYPSGVYEKEYLSEDWGFSRLASESGFPIFINTKVRLGHIGNHTFRLGQFYGQVDSPVKPSQTKDEQGETK